MTYMGKESENERLCVYAQLSHLAVHLKLIQYFNYTPIVKKKKKIERESTGQGWALDLSTSLLGSLPLHSCVVP